MNLSLLFYQSLSLLSRGRRGDAVSSEVVR
jgi:hypothetical protein